MFSNTVFFCSNFLDEFFRPSAYLIFCFRPFGHVPVFFMGFIFGCFVDRFKNNKKYLLSPAKRCLAWFATFGVYFFCCFSTLPWLHGRPYDAVWSAILFPLNMILWATHVSMTVWLCITNNGGYINRLLSASVLRPYSRMTYCVYLVHPWAYFILVGTTRSLYSTSLLYIASLWLAVVVLSYVIAFFFTVLFEAPVFHLLEYFKDRSIPEISDNETKREDEEAGNEKELQTLFNIQK